MLAMSKPEFKAALTAISRANLRHWGFTIMMLSLQSQKLVWEDILLVFSKNSKELRRVGFTCKMHNI